MVFGPMLMDGGGGGKSTGKKTTKKPPAPPKPRPKVNVGAGTGSSGGGKAGTSKKKVGASTGASSGGKAGTSKKKAVSAPKPPAGKSGGGQKPLPPKKAPSKGVISKPNNNFKMSNPTLPRPSTSTQGTIGSGKGAIDAAGRIRNDPAPKPEPVPEPPKPPSEEDYLAGDATYNATLAALMRQLEGFTADLDSQLQTRELDYNNALRDLGYSQGADGGAQWNYNDTLTASGRAYENLLNDFAARGMLQSQGFADSQNNLDRSLMDQYQGLLQSDTQFRDDLGRQRTRAEEDNTLAQQSARAEAIARRAAQYGLI